MQFLVEGDLEIDKMFSNFEKVKEFPTFPPLKDKQLNISSSSHQEVMPQGIPDNKAITVAITTMLQSDNKI